MEDATNNERVFRWSTEGTRSSIHLLQRFFLDHEFPVTIGAVPPTAQRIGKPVMTGLAKTSLGKAGIRGAAGAGVVGSELATETVTQGINFAVKASFIQPLVQPKGGVALAPAPPATGEALTLEAMVQKLAPSIVKIEVR